jgi:DNA mismatch endonuclease (patch repair protein)
VTRTDVFTAEQRSAVMARVKGRDTGPELKLRRLLHGAGYRYRLQVRDLPGRPDLAFPRRRAAVFVHGCFWHGHDCPRGARAPKANADYWQAKIARNRARDAAVQSDLAARGWTGLVVWECELKQPDAVLRRLRAALGPARQAAEVSCAPASSDVAPEVTASTAA